RIADTSVALPARFASSFRSGTSPARNRAFGLAPAWRSWLIVGGIVLGAAAILDVSTAIRKAAIRMPQHSAGIHEKTMKPRLMAVIHFGRFMAENGRRF